MKITKETLVRIIEEELQKNEQQSSSETAASKDALAKEFRGTALVIKNMDFDKNEVILVDAIVDSVLELANKTQGATVLNTILKFIKSRAGKEQWKLLKKY